MNRLIYFLGVIVYGFVFATPSAAQWVQTNGPSGRGGQINSYLVDGSNIFAGTNKGLYVSSDEGTSWLDVTPVAHYHSVISSTDFPIGQVSADGTKLLVTTIDGVSASSDNGMSWSVTNIPGFSGSGYPSAFVLSGPRLIG